MNAPKAYAPTVTSSYGAFGARSGVNYDQEITRSNIAPTPALRVVYDSLCEIYSILSALELVANAFVKDFLTDDEKYTGTVMRLINQYNTVVQTVTGNESNLGTLRSILPTLAADNSNFLVAFQCKFRLHTTRAAERLISGIPATTEQLPKEQRSEASALTPAVGANARLVAEATGGFITTMDALKLEYSSKQQLHPLLSSLVIKLNELSITSGDSDEPMSAEFAGKSKLISWLIKLNNLGDSQQLTAQEREDFLHDLDVAYRGFYNSLS
ncbi:putative vacuolar protein sorting-associated protein vps28 [Metschnikowia bicuspidata]|uniref:Vacuolar protein sorting-associated protein 28 n=1 Tax=Metschnikowia bicuspidata TaxID=27322 RepID=A0A4P9ZET2_9ASCO|nr:putative vacuolar protein sorting-associated protein vps28 [Metschnikowia bicuspidata]